MKADLNRPLTRVGRVPPSSNRTQPTRPKSKTVYRVETTLSRALEQRGSLSNPRSVLPGVSFVPFLELGFPRPPSRNVPRIERRPAIRRPRRKSGDLDLLPIPKLVAFLESSYRKSEYEQVSRILSSRVEHAMASLERQEAANTELQSRCWSLEYEASFLRARCGELEDRFRSGEAGASNLDQGLREEKGRSALLMARIEELEHAMRVGAEEKGGSTLLVGRTEEIEHGMRAGAVEVDRHKSKCELLEQKLELLRNKEEEWNDERIVLTRQNQAVKCELMRAQQEAKEEAERSRSKCELLEQKLDIAHDELKLLKLEKQQAGKQVNELQEKLDRARHDLKRLKHEKQQAEGHVNELLELLGNKERECNKERIALSGQNQAIECELRRAKEEADELRRKVDIMETQNLKLFQETLQLRDKVESLEDGKDSKEGITLLRETLELREKVESLGKGKDPKEGMAGSIIYIGDSDDEKDVGDRNSCEVICLDEYKHIKVEENGCSFYVSGTANKKRKRKYIPLSDSSCSS